MPTPGDYVLGTHDAEVERLGLQHRVWRERALDAWRRAGLAAGGRVLDVGAGPGWASLDLAELVGPTGRVVAVERSPRFAAELRAEGERRGLAQLQVVEADLMDDAAVAAMGAGPFDLAWCRWVASFVASPAALARTIARLVRPGGRVVAHEYVDYAAWRFVPPRPRLAEFVHEVMASWRASGGEPDVAASFAGALREAGFAVVSMRPHALVAAPDEPAWAWPASFVETNLARLVELGRVSGAWADLVRDELRAAAADPEARMLTPLVLEVIVERR